MVIFDMTAHPFSPFFTSGMTSRFLLYQSEASKIQHSQPFLPSPPIISQGVCMQINRSKFAEGACLTTCSVSERQKMQIFYQQNI